MHCGPHHFRFADEDSPGSGFGDSGVRTLKQYSLFVVTLNPDSSLGDRECVASSMGLGSAHEPSGHGDLPDVETGDEVMGCRGIDLLHPIHDDLRFVEHVFVAHCHTLVRAARPKGLIH